MPRDPDGSWFAWLFWGLIEWLQERRGREN